MYFWERPWATPLPVIKWFARARTIDGRTFPEARAVVKPPKSRSFALLRMTELGWGEQRKSRSFALLRMTRVGVGRATKKQVLRVAQDDKSWGGASDRKAGPSTAQDDKVNDGANFNC